MTHLINIKRDKQISFALFQHVPRCTRYFILTFNKQFAIKSKRYILIKKFQTCLFLRTYYISFTRRSKKMVLTFSRAHLNLISNRDFLNAENRTREAGNRSPFENDFIDHLRSVIHISNTRFLVKWKNIFLSILKNYNYKIKPIIKREMYSTVGSISHSLLSKYKIFQAIRKKFQSQRVKTAFHALSFAPRVLNRGRRRINWFAPLAAIIAAERQGGELYSSNREKEIMPRRINGDDLWKNGTNLREERHESVLGFDRGIVMRALLRNVIIDYLCVFIIHDL